MLLFGKIISRIWSSVVTLVQWHSITRTVVQKGCLMAFLSKLWAYFCIIPSLVSQLMFMFSVLNAHSITDGQNNLLYIWSETWGKKFRMPDNIFQHLYKIQAFKWNVIGCITRLHQVRVSTSIQDSNPIRCEYAWGHTLADNCEIKIQSTVNIYWGQESIVRRELTITCVFTTLKIVLERLLLYHLCLNSPRGPWTNRIVITTCTTHSGFRVFTVSNRKSECKLYTALAELPRPTCILLSWSSQVGWLSVLS
jgi:hypothetical protein